MILFQSVLLRQPQKIRLKVKQEDASQFIKNWNTVLCKPYFLNSNLSTKRLSQIPNLITLFLMLNLVRCQWTSDFNISR